MIIVVGGIKGGIAKTTVAINLAVMRQAAGRQVALVDADEQRSASEFSEQRSALGNGDLPCHPASGENTFNVLQELADRYEDIIVDVGGRDTRAQRAALLAADLVLFPFPVGSLDAWTLPQVERLVSEVRQANPELDAATFISRGFVQGPDNAEAAEMLRASTLIRYIDTPLIERRAYVRSSGEGLAVIEYRKPADPKATAEVRGLYDAVFNASAATVAA